MNRQSLAFSERNQLSQAIPQFHVERTLNEWTPIARFEAQHNESRACEDQFLCFGGRYDRQRTLAIRIAAITLASGSAITIARFRPSTLNGLFKTPFFDTKISLKNFRCVPFCVLSQDVSHINFFWGPKWAVLALWRKNRTGTRSWNRWKRFAGTTLTLLQSLLFSISFLYFSLLFLLFLVRFPSFSKDCRDSAKRKTPVSFRVSLVFFPKQLERKELGP